MSDDITVDPQNVHTPNLGLNKPLVGGDDDIWGDFLNENADILDTVITELRTDVQQLSGALLFIGTYDVVADYAEFAAASGFPNGPLPPASAANFNSYLVATTVGTGHGNAPPVAYNKGDWLVSDGSEWVHLALGTPPGGAIAASTVTVTPAVQGATNVQSALQQLDGAQAQYLPLSGLPATMAGPLRTSLGNASNPALQVGTAAAGFWALGNTMFINAESQSVLQLNGTTVTATVPVTLPSGDPAQPQYAASKAYVDNKASVSNPLMNGAVAIGTATTFARADHVHPSDTSRAPLISPVFSGNPTAPTPAPGDNDASIATTQFVQTAVSLTPAANNIGRNYIHNPLFNIAQRGVGPFTANGYTLDRWQLSFSLDTNSLGQAQLSDAARAAIGDEEAFNCVYNNFTGNAGAAAYSAFQQKIENVRRLANKTVTVSFWAACSAGALKLGINAVQQFGTGGSPSAAVQVLATGISVTLSTTWARYSATFALPSIAGKTLGTNNDSATVLQIFNSSGANGNALAGNIGVQSGQIDLWGVQLEIGSVATPLQKADPRYDLSNCQRFAVILNLSLNPGFVSAASGVGVPFPVQMHHTPTAINISAGSVVSATMLQEAALDRNAAFFQISTTAVGGYVLNRLTVYAADL